MPRPRILEWRTKKGVHEATNRLGEILFAIRGERGAWRLFAAPTIGGHGLAENKRHVGQFDTTNIAKEIARVGTWTKATPKAMKETAIAPVAKAAKKAKVVKAAVAPVIAETPKAKPTRAVIKAKKARGIAKAATLATPAATPATKLGLAPPKRKAALRGVQKAEQAAPDLHTVLREHLSGDQDRTEAAAETASV